MNNKRLLPVILILTLLICVFPVTASATEYTPSDGETLDVSSCISGDVITIGAGRSVTLDGKSVTLTNIRIICEAGVNLTLKDVTIANTTGGYCPATFTGENNTLTVTGENSLSAGAGAPGVSVSDASLHICGTGNLTARGGATTSGYGGAGIGAAGGSTYDINIEGGNITAIAGATNTRGAALKLSPGISASDISITGGTVTSTGYYGCAGIGSDGSADGSSIIISGGVITAIASKSSVGIGGTTSVARSDNKIMISGGRVIATCSPCLISSGIYYAMGTGIGDSYHGYDDTRGTIQLTGGEIFSGFAMPAGYTAGGYDIGGANIFKDTTNWTVSIGGSAKVFLFNNRSSGLTTPTHINKTYDAGTAEVYGVIIPEGWQSAGFGAYLRSCTLTYDENGGDGAAPDSVTRLYGAAVTLSDGSGLSLANYHFDGWNTAADGSGDSYAAGGSYTLEANTTLHAKWAANAYTVSYDANGGTVTPAAQVKLYGSAYGKASDGTTDCVMPTPTWAGHTFAGWYTAASGGTRVNDSDTVSITENTTLYAHWETKSYISSATVTMMAAVAGAAPQTVEQVETATANADYTVSNVVWNEAMTAENLFKAGQVYTATVTLTSKNGKEFQTAAFTPAVEGSSTVGTTTTTGTGTGNTASFTVAFPATAAQSVTDTAVKTQPARLTYTEGETLDLSGLAATLTYNDGSTADVAFAQFAAHSITASPANGAALSVSAHDGKPVTLTCNGQQATTSNLAVSAAVPSAPSAPTIQSAIAGDAHVSITWNSVSGATGYKIFKSTTSGSYGTALATVGGSVNNYDATGLYNGTTYYFVVKASNDGGDSFNSNEISAMPQIEAPGAPVLQSASSGDGYVNITWSGVAGSTGYKVYASTTPGNYISPATTVAGAVFSCDVTGLTNGITYYFAVKATNPGGDSAFSNEINAMPKVEAPGAPIAPTGVTATGGKAKVTLNWNSVTGATEYKIYQSTASGSYGTSLATVSASVCSYEATGLINGVTYYYVIKAANAGGDGPNSAEVSAMPKTVPGAPVNVTAAAGNREAAVSFTAPVDNGGGPITGYIATSSPGNITATGTGTTIAVTGLINGTAYTFTVKAVNEVGNGPESAVSNTVTPHSESGGESGGSSTTTQPVAQPPTDSGVVVSVNGRTENVGTATTTTEENKTVTTITVDSRKLEQKLEAEGNNAVVTISEKAKSDMVVGELNGQIVKKMESKQAVLELKTENATYTLPAQQIDISAISTQVGSNVELKDIKVQVEVSKAAAGNVQLVENSAKQGEFSIIAPPVEFSVKCTYADKTVEVSSFNAYVERTIAIPDGINPDKITTGIIVDPDATTRHVPTRVTVIDGKYYAVINSLTNSLYSVVWHPMEFKDVANHWAKEAVNDMGSRMVIGGVGNNLFEPDRDITRAEFAAIVVKALGLKPGSGSNPFTDVSDTAWYCNYIKTAVEYKLISGCDNGKFGSNNKITREQAMTIIARAMNITGLKAGLNTGEFDKLPGVFTDADKAADYAKNAIAACVDSGVVSGRSDKLIAPKDSITRAEVAVIVQRLLQKSGLI